ncbi:unnamed protein product [Candida verbasci]|uniref:Band 7 domain-containing protein n=1 Tax=Candida verbasci TaxID=1227364 RepID=A0A9W4XFF6_9ASCO|nr:unnamed protein product [Candida verbasci]
MEGTSLDQSSFTKPINEEPHVRPEMVLKNFAKEYKTPPQDGYQTFISGLGNFFGAFGMYGCICSNPMRKVDQGEVGLVQTFGRLSRAVEPGLNYVNTWSEKLTRVSIKINIREIPAQKCFTRDNVSVIVTSVVYYNIIDPQKAIFTISDIHEAIAERTQNTLRDVIGGRILQDVVEKREELAESIQHIIAKTAFDWGVNIESILIKDLTLPDKVQASLSMATEAKRIGESKIITAKAEVESAKLMRKAADILASPAAMQIRYLDALQGMAKNPGTRVIFMPSAHEVERAATANIPKGTTYKEVEEGEEEELGHTSTGNRHITDTLALQEAMHQG